MVVSSIELWGEERGGVQRMRKNEMLTDTSAKKKFVVRKPERVWVGGGGWPVRIVRQQLLWWYFHHRCSPRHSNSFTFHVEVPFPGFPVHVSYVHKYYRDTKTFTCQLEANTKLMENIIEFLWIALFVVVIYLFSHSYWTENLKKNKDRLAKK